MSNNNNKYKDFMYFVKNYDSIYNKYGHKFIVIKNEAVLGAYSSIMEALLETNKTNEYRSYIIQECYPK